MSTVRVLCFIDDVYYAPQIVARQLGFFADEGLRVEVDPSAGPAGAPAGVASGRAEYGLGGLWHPWVFVGHGQPFAAFAQMNQQVPLRMLARRGESFDWASLDGGALLLTSSGVPSPWCAVQGLLDTKGVELGSMRLVVGYSPEEAAGVFAAGSGELLEVFAGRSGLPVIDDQRFEPVVDWPADLGRLPWTVYFCTPDRLRRHTSEAVALTRALHRALEWLRAHSAEEITEVVAPWFDEADHEAIGRLVELFVEQEQWPADPRVEPESVERWRAILVRAGVLPPSASAADIVVAEIAAAAME